MNSEAIRRSLVGACIGAVLFGAVSVYRSLLAGGSLLDYVGPIGMMTVIGGTVGGLVGPLIGRAWRRSRDRRQSRADAPERAGGAGAHEGDGRDGTDRAVAPEGSEGVGAAEGTEAPTPVGASGGRQPFWFTLLVGVAVGWGVGTAWGRVWIGVALGVMLALLARRVFR